LCEDAVYQSILEIFAGVKKGVGQGPVGSTNRGEIKQLVEVDPLVSAFQFIPRSGNGFG
jgi:hypothetical protein